MIPTFELHRAADVHEAVSLLSSLEDAACYAGGTELLQVMKMGFATPGHLVDLKPITELGGIEQTDAGLRIGATVTHREIERSPLIAEQLPALVALEHQVANIRIRNVGTLGGNLCFAEPHSDPAALLVACNATVTLAGTKGSRRTIPLEEFLLDAFTTDREEAEVMTGVTIPLADSRALAYRRYAMTERPTVSVAVQARIEDDRLWSPRIVVGAVGPTPTVCRASGNLDGLTVDEARSAAGDVASACSAEVEPLDIVEVGEAYLRDLVAVHVRRTLADLVEGRPT
ncbi:MAG: FAD binding domain-containing protein [Actinomycetota bacterium]